MDQIGTGQVDGASTATMQPQQPLKSYIWANTRTSTDANLDNNAPLYLVDGRDYEFCGDDSCTPVDYTPYTYPHPFTLSESETPPTRSNPQPTGTLPTGTTTTNISLTTDINATCRYSNISDTNYTDMTLTFQNTDSTTHSTIVLGLENGHTYIYYIRCADKAGNVNTDDFPITFSVAELELPELALHGAPADRSIRLTWTVSGTLPISSAWQIDYDGPAGDQPSPISGIISPTRAYTLTGLTNHTWYTVTLSAMHGSVSFLADTVRVMPSGIFVYLPLVLR